MKKNNLIYHYTNADSFIKIIESKQIWATDLKSTNDPRETNLATDLIHSLVRDKFPNDADTILPRENSVYFSCSFSKSRDLLSQWRGYAEQGKGFAIGVDREKLENINKNFPKNDMPFKIFDVFYCKKEYSAYWEKEIDNYIKNDLSFNKNNIDKIWQHYIQHDLTLFKAMLKDPFFTEEKEVRCCYRITPPTEYSTYIKSKYSEIVKFRSCESRITPYIPLSLRNESTQAISEIILGPQNSSDIGHIKKFLWAHGLSDIKLSKSDGVLSS